MLGYQKDRETSTGVKYEVNGMKWMNARVNERRQAKPFRGHGSSLLLFDCS